MSLPSDPSAVWNGQPYRVFLTDTQTGEQRMVEDAAWKWEDGTRYWWVEGNMACDCNRFSLFYGGEDAPCNLGSRRRFTLDLIQIGPKDNWITQQSPESLGWMGVPNESSS